MAKLLRSGFMLGALSALMAPVIARAQIRSHVRVAFRNRTPYFVWVTFYESVSKGPFRVEEILREGDRTGTGPLQVGPNKTYTFDLPRRQWLKCRCEPLDACGNKFADTSATRNDIRAETAIVDFVLHQRNKSFWITM